MDEPRPNNEAEEFMIMSQSQEDGMVVDGASPMKEQRKQMNISNSSRQGNLANELMKEVHVYELTDR